MIKTHVYKLSFNHNYISKKDKKLSSDMPGIQEPRFIGNVPLPVFKGAEAKP